MLQKAHKNEMVQIYLATSTIKSKHTLKTKTNYQIEFLAQQVFNVEKEPLSLWLGILVLCRLILLWKWNKTFTSTFEKKILRNIFLTMKHQRELH